MADQGQWFKLWISALSDPDLCNLDLADVARWVLLGAYTKAHGTDGRLDIKPPARSLCDLFRVPDFDAVRSVFHRLPNVVEEMHNGDVSGETSLTVTFRNWKKYQGDFSTYRVRKYREMKRSKRRGEEKRRDEIRQDNSPPPPAGDSSNGHRTLKSTAQELLDFLNHKAGKNFQPKTNRDLIEARLRDGATPEQCRAIIGRKTSQWKGTDMAMYLRPETLFNRTKFAQYLGELPATAFTPEGGEHA